jgi:short-subunit dehydrogenase
MAINVVATMKLVQAFLPFFEAQAWSTILNVGSTFGSIGFPGYVSYCASKHALKGFTEALRRELSMSSTSVLYVSPRATATAMNHERVDELNEKLSVTVDSPEAVAAQIVEVLYTDRPTSQLGWPEKLQVKLNAVFPTLVDKSIASQLATIKAYF